MTLEIFKCINKCRTSDSGNKLKSMYCTCLSIKSIYQRIVSIRDSASQGLCRKKNVSLTLQDVVKILLFVDINCIRHQKNLG